MASRLRYIIGVGFWNVSLSVASGLEHAPLDLLGPLAQVHVARVQLGPGVQDGDERLAQVLLVLDAELAHPRPVAEGPQPRGALAAEPAVAAQVFRLLRGHVRPQ